MYRVYYKNEGRAEKTPPLKNLEEARGAAEFLKFQGAKGIKIAQLLDKVEEVTPLINPMKDPKDRKCKCLRESCGHEWTAKSDKVPKCCPMCKSYQWNQPRVGEGAK